MRRRISVLLALCLVFLLAFSLMGCMPGEEEPTEPTEPTEPAEPEVVFPTRPIRVIVSFGAGGGTDVGARILMPFVEEELGVALEVVNKPGAGGWVGWAELLTAESDGYTIGYINTPSLMSGYLNPELEREQRLEDFAVIANHVIDYGAIAVDYDDNRFNNLDELVEYAKANELTTTSTGVAGDDHLAALRLNKEMGTQFVAIHGRGAVYGIAGVMGGHIDVAFANVGELKIPHANKELRILAVMSPERSEFLPDIPTVGEVLGYEIRSWSARGLAAPGGIDPVILEILQDAFESAINNPEQIKRMNDLGLAVSFIRGDDYFDFLKEEEREIKVLLPLLGWE